MLIFRLILTSAQSQELHGARSCEPGGWAHAVFSSLPSGWVAPGGRIRHSFDPKPIAYASESALQNCLWRPREQPVGALALRSLCPPSCLLGQSTMISGLPVLDMLPENHFEYYTYHGSLTTPPCTENVRWFVLQDSVKLSRAQVALAQAVGGTERAPGFLGADTRGSAADATVGVLPSAVVALQKTDPTGEEVWEAVYYTG